MVGADNNCGYSDFSSRLISCIALVVGNTSDIGVAPADVLKTEH